MTTSNFEEIVGKEKYVVVKFYTKWCGYCRIMAPEYDKLFDMYKDKRSDLIIARLEGSVNESISMKYGIFSFPMVVLFLPGDLHIRALFQKQRLASVISEWIEENAPSREEAKMLEDKPKVVDEEKPKLINQNKLDENLIIIKANKTEVTDELEFIKREVITLKSKMEKLENEIQLFKNKTNTDVNFPNKLFELPSTTSLFFIFGLIVILISLGLTIKKILLKKGSMISGDNAHAKV